MKTIDGPPSDEFGTPIDMGGISDSSPIDADAAQEIEDFRTCTSWPVEASWLDIETQLDYWRDLDIEYWSTRKQEEYRRWLRRQAETQ